MKTFILSFAVILFNIYVFDAEILYFDTKHGAVTKDENTAKNSEDTYGAHLPLSVLFKQSSKYNCMKNDGECQGDGQDHEAKVYFGPRHQKIHLALPRTEMKEVWFWSLEDSVSELTLNSKCLSQKLKLNFSNCVWIKLIF